MTTRFISQLPVFDCHVHGPTTDGNFVQMAPLFTRYSVYLDYLSAQRCCTCDPEFMDGCYGQRRAKVLPTATTPRCLFGPKGSSKEAALIPRRLITQP